MEEMPIVNNEECVELKNIKYKTMLLSGVPIKETKSANDLSNLEKFLENEQNNNKNDPWCKLDKTIKTKKSIGICKARPLKIKRKLIALRLFDNNKAIPKISRIPIIPVNLSI